MEKADQFIILFGLKIFEPATILTSLVISGLCYVFFFRIKKDPARRDINSWRFFFLFLGTSSVVGCFVHGIHEQWGKNAFDYLNLTRNIFSLLASFFCFRGTLFYVEKNENLLKKINLFLYVYIALAIIVTILINLFLIVIINAGIFVLYTLIAHIIAYKKGSKGSGWILAAFGIAPFPIAVHIFKISFNEYFNSKDIAHIFIWISLWFIYKGISAFSKTEV